MASSATFDFTTDPAQIPGITINGNNDTPWQQSGGNPGGFLAVTYPEGGQFTIIVFPDVDAGKLVKAFKFEADLRVGNSTGPRAADGFSVSFARGNDPILADPTQQGPFAGGIAEGGATTGIAVSFDTWSGNTLPDGGDIEGIIVRVDNVTINRTGLPTRHGACDDNTSLQTGPRNQAYWDGGGDPRGPESWAQLCWKPMTIDLDDSGKLTVIWKGRKVLDAFQTTYFPSVGRLILAGRTGGANEHTHFDNIRITTTLADSPIVGLPQGSGCGFTIPIADAGPVIPVQNTITMTVNGAAVTPSIVKNGDVTVLTLNQPAGTAYASGSTNVVTVSFTDSNQKVSSSTRNFVVPAYTTFPASAATTQFTSSSSGFTVRVHQIETGRGPGDANATRNAEQQLVPGGGYFQANGSPYPNIAQASGTASGLYETTVVNWEQNAGAAGNFTANSDPSLPDENIPGIPGTTDSTDNIAAEILTFLELPQGCTTLGVNSDDGFTVRLGHSVFGPLLGQFNGGRGAADTTFRVFAPTAGVYPIRLSWWEGGGGANVEFFSVDAAGKRHLINDRTDAAALKAYSVGKTLGRLASISPYPGYGGVDLQPTIAATFQNDISSVDNASIKLLLDGAQVAANTATSGNTVTTSFKPAAKFAYGSTHTARVIYTIGGTTYTNDSTFTVRGLAIQDLSAGFAIEAEHFDYDTGKFVASVNGGSLPNTYEGGEYQGLGAVNNVDYAQGGNEASNAGYREGEDPNVPMDSQTGGDLDTQRPGFAVTTNYKIGWAGGDWYNYTRTIPAGTYKIVGALSHGDAAGTANRHVARYGLVTSGKGTSTQSAIEIGRHSTPASGTWGINTLSVVQLGGKDGVYKIPAGFGQQVWRVWVDSGDWDWFAFVPTTETAPGASITATPANGAASAANLDVTVVDLFRNTTVAANAVKLFVNGQDVTSTANVTDTFEGVTMRYSPQGGVVDYAVVFTDSAGTTATNTGRFTSIRSAQNFVIEAEDFNFGGGQTMPAASTMPLTAGLYDGLSATHEIDYHLTGNTPDSDLYRKTESPNVPMNDNAGSSDRGTFTLTQNYKIGWVDDTEWYNYTRTFPGGNYNVFAAISHGGGDGDQTAGSLQLVTSAATSPDQTVQQLGRFRQAGASGGWGVNRILPLVDTNNNLISVPLSGLQTIRYTAVSGDYDYLLFTPALSNFPQDVTAPGDTIAPVGGTFPAGEAVANAINGAGQKYLNFGIDPAAAPFVGPVGLTVTPARGATVVTGMRIYTANDATARDPKDVMIEGSNDGTAFTPIATLAFDLPLLRNAGGTSLIIGGFGQTVWFPNTAAYKTYRVMFQNVRDNAAANSVQFAELELLGTGGSAPETGPTIAVSRSGANITFTWAGGGSLEASPVVGTGATWTTVDSDGSYTTTAQGAKMFFRVKR